jgi:hypothetical protein
VDPFIEKIILALIVGVIGFISSYAIMKSKNRSLKKDIAMLADEKQKIISKYEIELEELKKTHTLDIEKRKTIFHEKLNLFSKYLESLSEFRRKCTEDFTKDIWPSINEVSIEYANAVINGKNLKIEELLKPLYNSINFSSKKEVEYRKIMTETIKLKLFGSPEIRGILDDIEKLVGEFYDFLNPFLRNLPNQVQAGNIEGAKHDMEKNFEIPKKLEEKERQLEDLMRQEMDKI